LTDFEDARRWRGTLAFRWGGGGGGASLDKSLALRNRRHSARDAAKSLRKAAVMRRSASNSAPTRRAAARPSADALREESSRRSRAFSARSAPAALPLTDRDDDRGRGARSSCATRSLS